MFYLKQIGGQTSELFNLINMTMENAFIGGEKPFKKLTEYKKVSEEKKEELFETLEKNKEAVGRALEKISVPLTEKQKEVLKIVYSEIEERLDKYGVSPDAFKDVKLFFLKPAIFEKLKKPDKNEVLRSVYKGQYKVMFNMAMVKYYEKYKNDEDLANWTTDTLHELLHSRSYQTLQLCENKKKPHLMVSRMGPYILKEKGKGVGTYFEWLNESLVTELAVKIAKKIVNQNKDLFAGQKEDSEGGKKTDIEPDDYWFYKEVLDGLIKGIAKKKEKDPEEIFGTFSKSLFTDNLLEIGRLTEEVYGPGSLRVLANVDEYTHRDALKYVDPDISPRYRRKLARNIIRGKDIRVKKIFKDEYEVYKKHRKLVNNSSHSANS